MHRYCFALEDRTVCQLYMIRLLFWQLLLALLPQEMCRYEIGPVHAYGQKAIWISISPFSFILRGYKSDTVFNLELFNQKDRISESTRPWKHHICVTSWQKNHQFESFQPGNVNEDCLSYRVLSGSLNKESLTPTEPLQTEWFLFFTLF